MRPSVGHINFLICLPLYYGLVKGSGILDVDLLKGTPTELNAMMTEGRLDIGPVSSIEYARHADQLVLLPGPTVSCRGPVRSISLVSRYPLQELHGRRIGLTGASATSQVLLKILLARGYGVSPEYFPYGDRVEEALQAGDAALLIGDRALENLSPGEGLLLYDLGDEWLKLSGCGMVFAVWVARREFAASRGPLVEHVWRLFHESTAYFMDNLSDIARDAARWESFPAAFLEEYFRTLSFDFTEDLRKGLLHFYGEAVSLGELERPCSLEFFNMSSLPAAGREESLVL